MKRWQKTTMKWDCFLGIHTNIPVTDWPHNDGKEYVHTIHEVEATSLPDRECKLVVGIRRVAISPTTQRAVIQEIIAREIEGFGNRVPANVTNSDYSPIWTIQFFLSDGEQFCESVINIVREIFSRLGVNDERGIYLANFTIKQETFVRLDDAWISFARWLRIQNRLPVWCSEDIRDQASQW